MGKEVVRRGKELGQDEKKVTCWEKFLLWEEKKSVRGSF